MKKHVLSLLVMILFCVAVFCGCTSGGVTSKTTTFTDSLGREVTIPENVNRIIPSGQLAQIFLLSVCPDKMVAIASNWDESADDFIPESVKELPNVGQIYGGKKDFNLESVLKTNPDVVIDIGDYKEGMKEDLDAIQEQIGIPVIHLEGSLDNIPEAYRRLGKMVGMEKEGEERAEYCERKNEEMTSLSARISREDGLLIAGPEGLNVIPVGSHQGEVFEMFVHNLAVVENPSGKGTGNEVDMEQILNWNPNVIVYLPEFVSGEVFDGELWENINAVKNGKVFRAPFGPYNWMGFPGSVQKYLGMMWMADTVVAEDTGFNLYDEVKEYFKLFYGHELTKEEFNKLIEQ